MLYPFILRACSLVALLMLGCENGPPMGDIAGTVTFNGVPLADGSVTFNPSAGDAPTSGALIHDGKFTARVSLGKHSVTISVPQSVGSRKLYDTPDSPTIEQYAEMIPSKYNTSTELTIDVQRGRQAVTFALTDK